MTELKTIYQIQEFARQIQQGTEGKIPGNLGFNIELERKEFKETLVKLTKHYNQPEPVYWSGLVLKYNCHGIGFKISQSRNECHRKEFEGIKKEIKNGKDN